jgi:hypothetical protein
MEQRFGATIHDLKGKLLWEYGSGGGNGHQEEHHDLFADLRKGVIPNEGEYGALSSMTSIFGRMATYSGKRISWQECLNSDLVIAPVDQIKSMEDIPPVVPDANGAYAIPMPGSNTRYF